MKVMKMIVGAEQPKKEQLKQLETVINDVVLQEVINKTPLTKEKMLRKLLLKAITAERTLLLDVKGKRVRR